MAGPLETETPMRHRRGGLTKTISGLRSGLYAGARLLGDVQALSRGPGAFLRRMLRKRLLKEEAKLNRKILGS